jgi:hypothetical protein
VGAVPEEQNGGRVVGGVQLEMAGDVDHRRALAQGRAQVGAGKPSWAFETPKPTPLHWGRGWSLRRVALAGVKTDRR